MLTGFASACVVTALLAFQPAGPDPSAEFNRRLHELALEGQPASGANARELIQPVADAIRAVTKRVVEEQFPDESAAGVDLQALTRENATPKEREVARAVLTALLASDVPRLTAELAAAPRSFRAQRSGMLLDGQVPELGLFRQIARFQSGRMTVAQEQRDDAEWMTAFEESLRLARHAAQEPILIADLVGIAMQALAFDAALRRIAAGADDALLARMARAVVEYPLPGADRPLRGEELMALDAMELVYDTGPSGMKFLQSGGAGGKAPPRPATPVVPDGQAMGPGMPARAEHERLIGEFYAALVKSAALPRSQRTDADVRATLERARAESLILQLVGPAVEKSMDARDQIRAQRTGLLIVIALERFKLARGMYPERLADLPAELLTEPAIDPYTGGPLGYLPPARGPYEGGRAYVLYAAGVDAKDDGGTVNFKEPWAVNKSGGTGDYLLNPHAGPGK